MTKLLLDVGAGCEAFQDKALRGLNSKRIQCDEIWSFVYAKAKNVPEAHKGDLTGSRRRGLHVGAQLSPPR